jgi:hypothetical protein
MVVPLSLTGAFQLTSRSTRQYFHEFSKGHQHAFKKGGLEDI